MRCTSTGYVRDRNESCQAVTSPGEFPERMGVPYPTERESPSTSSYTVFIISHSDLVTNCLKGIQLQPQPEESTLAFPAQVHIQRAVNRVTRETHTTDIY